MKYEIPYLLSLTSYSKGTCYTGSGGETKVRNCHAGTTADNGDCSTGSANTSGHCYGGQTVSNDGAARYCGTGSSADPMMDCANGSRAVGGTPANTGCGVGSSACHCANGSGA
jgi:hypothetical protein